MLSEGTMQRKASRQVVLIKICAKIAHYTFSKAAFSRRRLNP